MRYFPKTNLVLCLPTLSGITCLSEVNKGTRSFSPLAGFSTSQCESESCSVVSGSLLPHGPYSLWNSSGQNTGVGILFPSLEDLPNPGIEPRSPSLQMDSLTTEPSVQVKGNIFSPEVLGENHLWGLWTILKTIPNVDETVCLLRWVCETFNLAALKVNAYKA